MLGEQRKQEIGLPVPGTGPQQCDPGIAAGFPVVDEGLQDRGGRYETGLDAELPGQRVDICATFFQSSQRSGYVNIAMSV